MAKNLTGKQAGTVKGDQVNDPSVRVIRGKNQFPQSFSHPTTNRYGEVDPCFAFKGERGDTIPYSFHCDLNTFTMASPMKSKVNMYSAAFKVPMQAIYPRNWDIMYPIPNKGDDIPTDGTGADTCRALFDVYSFGKNLIDAIKSSTDVNFAIRGVFILESIFSAGSLFSKFNMHFDGARFTSTFLGSCYFDEWFDSSFAPNFSDFFLNADDSIDGLSDYSLYHHSDPSLKYVVTRDSKKLSNPTAVGSDVSYISFRRALELLRTGEYLLNTTYFESFTPDRWFDLSLVSTYADGVEPFTNLINLEPIVAYQLACAHFFSNSKVDFVYSAQLYRDNMQSLIYGRNVVPAFEWNGIQKYYDVFSVPVLGQALLQVFNSALNNQFNATAFFLNLFSFKNSLRYADYFTGAHPEPLAVGDVNAPVVDGSVNALDMTRKLQLTRLLNKVNISGPRIEDYLRALFGGSIPQAPKDVPIRLSVEKFNIDGFEVNNTGAAQLSSDSQNITTTNLRMNDSRYMFEVEVDEPCWIVGVQYYDAERIYSRTMTRFAFHHNRFDDFIPDMQFIGDQDVKSQEIDFLGRPKDTAFAYNLRYMEYKNSYSYASGGFIRALRSWAFVTDNFDGASPESNITPQYIRSVPSEFDRFYKSLTGYSLGTYFHFICFNTNVIAPYRQMVYAPEILA